MKSFLTLTLAVFSATSPLWGELQEKQLAKGVKLQYQQWDRKGDENRFEWTIKDPHLYWLDGSSMVPQLMGEIDHQGTWKINVDVPANKANFESDGLTHIMLNPSETASGSQNQVDVTLKGKVTKNIKGDLSTIRDSFKRMREEGPSEERWLTILESIKEGTAEAKDLSVLMAGEGQKPTLVESMLLNYQHTSGAMPVEYALKAKVSGDYQLVMGNTTLSFPAIGKYESLSQGKMALPEWRDMAAFVHAPFSKGLPNVKIDWSNNVTSQVGDSGLKISFTSSTGEHSFLEWGVKGQSLLTSSWAKIVEGVQKQSTGSGEENQGALFLYQWLKSPQTLPFLSLLPQQSSLDWNGSINYLPGSAMTVDQGNMILDWLGKDQKGVKIRFNGLNTQNNAPQGDLQIIVAGGRATYDYWVALYNAFKTSLAPLTQKYDINQEIISSETQENLFKALVAYVDDASAQGKELKFTIKYTPSGTTIGGKSIYQFVSDVSALFGEEAKKQESVQEQAPALMH